MANTEERANDQVRVPFADGPTDHMALDHAEQFLRVMYAQHRETFAVILAAVMTGVAVRRPIQRRPPR